MADNEGPSLGGRLGRYARVGASVGGLAARLAGERYLGWNLDRGKHAAELRSALGGLKGPLMKAAQLLATIPDALPPEYANELAQLQANAPAMGWAFVKRRMATELGPDWPSRFVRFDKEASFAASLGQVHRAELPEGREVVTVEDQNKFTLPGRATTLGGKPDIVAVRDCEGLVVDCKSGQQRDSAWFQVLTYMRVLPLTDARCGRVRLAGEVQYREASVRIEPEQLDDMLKALIRGVIEHVGGDEAPRRVPSYAECRFCDLTAADCPNQVELDTRVSTVEHDLF